MLTRFYREIREKQNPTPTPGKVREIREIPGKFREIRENKDNIRILHQPKYRQRHMTELLLHVVATVRTTVCNRGCDEDEYV